MSPQSIDQDNVPYISGNPEQDWETAAYILAVGLEHFAPKLWLEQASSDPAKFLDYMMNWYTNYIPPRLSYYHEVVKYYSNPFPDPF